MNSWWTLLYIEREMAILPDDATRERIWKEIEHKGDAQVSRAWWAALGTLVSFFLGRVLGSYLWTLAGPLQFGWKRAWGWILGGLVAALFGIFCYWRMRRIYQRLLRERISAEGIPLCVCCGYCLVGLEQPQRCPECGGAPGAAKAPPEPSVPPIATRS